MSIITIQFINVKNNPCGFCDPFTFEIRFECCKKLDDDLEWKLVYVGSADNEDYDQVLEDVFVGPVNVGINQFILQTPGPDPSKVPAKDLLGVSVVLLSALFHGREFVRVGYFINNHYRDEELNLNPPPVSETSPINTDLVERKICDDKPRITLFPIDWENPDAPPEMPPPQNEGADDAAVEELADSDEFDDDDEDDEDDDGDDDEMNADASDSNRPKEPEESATQKATGESPQAVPQTAMN